MIRKRRWLSNRYVSALLALITVATLAGCTSAPAYPAMIGTFIVQ